MKRKVKNSIIAVTSIMLITGGILLGADAIENSKDITPPYGRLEIQGATEVNNINYVDRTSIILNIYASDDFSKAEEIKYYVSTDPISNTEKLADNLWKNYYEGVTETIELPNISSVNTIYAAFKDKAENTSIIYTGENMKYTVTYDANGGENAPAPQTTYYAMPLNLTSEKPEYKGKYFKGWSTNKNATEAEYYQNELLETSKFTSSDRDMVLYAVWADEIVELPLLSEKVKVGDYVNYPVHYDNVPTYNGLYTASLKGWRVLSVEDDGTVNLVSAGTPLTYYQGGSAETSIKNLCINFLDTPFGKTEKETFTGTGFNPYISLREVFNNKYTGTYEANEIVSYTSTYANGTVVTYSGEKVAGDLKVRSMTKEDADKIYDKTGEKVIALREYVKDAKYQKMLAVPVVESSKYAEYILASADSGSTVWHVDNRGWANYSLNIELGVRPVVSLKSMVKTTGKDMLGVWQIEIE